LKDDLTVDNKNFISTDNIKSVIVIKDNELAGLKPDAFMRWAKEKGLD
jgi:hypothetical protein